MPSEYDRLNRLLKGLLRICNEDGIPVSFQNIKRRPLPAARIPSESTSITPRSTPEVRPAPTPQGSKWNPTSPNYAPTSSNSNASSPHWNPTFPNWNPTSPIRNPVSPKLSPKTLPQEFIRSLAPPLLSLNANLPPVIQPGMRAL